ncbi:MAG: LysR family transcriptional regulator [Acidimicrobiales bacterium]
MERRQIEYFVGIVDYGGFTKAAQGLHVAQPSLSRAMRNLERELGVTLFHRVGRGVVLSNAGEELLDLARLVLRGMDAMHARARAIDGGAAGRVDVAATSSSALEPVTSIVAELRETHPGIAVRILPAVCASEVVGMTQRGRCEIGVCGHAVPPTGDGLVAHHLRDEEFLLVLSPDSLLDTHSRIAPSELQGRGFVVTQPSTALRDLFVRFAALVGNMDVAVEVGHREAILPMVLKGIGAALLPDTWEDMAQRVGAKVYRFTPPELLPQWLVRRRSAISPAAQAFMDAAFRIQGGGPTELPLPDPRTGRVIA